MDLELHERRMTAAHALSTLLEGASPQMLEDHMLLAAVLMSTSTYSWLSLSARRVLDSGM